MLFCVCAWVSVFVGEQRRVSPTVGRHSCHGEKAKLSKRIFFVFNGAVICLLTVCKRVEGMPPS